ncbi:hypothetical protein GGQ99_005161 [Aminobacter niigataensis]|uniref:50S ribosomal protein L29 n=1 Tax=Aminobacter niigataensis TaxID=83265 RepID=A0ABR6LBI8_9HYPH|nr:hypothetical protein [Aminobacter niigataensis]MBB4653370.1 hypothetical protein [Aminobacter niigataensis]
MAEDDTQEAPAETLSNSDRLLQHLKADSLAARLVLAQKKAANPAAALKTVLTERLDQVRKDLSGDEN